MFESWGRRVYAWRHATLWVSGLTLLFAALSLVLGGRLTSSTIRGIEADTGRQLAITELHNAATQGFTLIFHSERLTSDDEEFQHAVLDAVAPLRGDRHVVSVTTPFEPGISMFLSQGLIAIDSHRVIVPVALTSASADDTRIYQQLRARVHSSVLEVTSTGPSAFQSDLDHVLQEDLVRAEVISTPFSVLVLLLVFGSAVAALLPAGVGGLAVVCGVAFVTLLSRQIPVAQVAINVVSLVGLGVAIDYSLFIVSRFRDELDAGATVPDAIATAVATAGRAVTFSGIAVAIGLSGLLFFRGSYLASLGLGGTIVVALAVIYALTFLPALLGVLGHRISRGKLPLGRYLHVRSGFWRKVATGVMKHPILVLIPTLTLLVFAALPFRHIQVAVPDVNVLPARTESRRGDVAMHEHFPERAANRVAVIVQFPGGPLANAARVGALYDFSRRLAAIPGVDHVESIVDVNPLLDRDGTIHELTSPRADFSEPMLVAASQSVGPTIAVLAAVTDAPPASAQARAIVHAARATRTVADGRVYVTGQTAMDVDSAAYMRARVPLAAGFVIAMTIIVLFVLLGSVVLPIKAILMNLLSITGSFGALVWIFQLGHFHTLLRFTPGPIDPSLPIVMFCATFGLSMDYEVLLLTRMQEEYDRTGDNRHSVAEGLERSGRLITSAAAIMVVVFAAFATTEIVLLKAIGLGMAIAVALDATVVRLLVVPATMRLFGALNWWAPGPLARFQQKLKDKGIGH